jgi:hypothetical protein
MQIPWKARILCSLRTSSALIDGVSGNPIWLYPEYCYDTIICRCEDKLVLLDWSTVWLGFSVDIPTEDLSSFSIIFCFLMVFEYRRYATLIY